MNIDLNPFHPSFPTTVFPSLRVPSSQDLVIPDIRFRRAYQNVDKEAIKQMFDQYDTDKSGSITLDEFEGLLSKIGVAPLKNPRMRGSASKDAEKGSIRDA